jgi:choline-sulfatase
MAALRFIVAVAAAAASTSSPPLNVVIMTSDSMDGRVLDGAQHLGKAVQLPALRSLAARGTNFVSAYTASPVCGPSRVAALTSRLPHDTGTWNNYQELPADITGALDASCVRLYGAARCGAWAARYPAPSGILFDAFADAGFDVKVLGKVDVGANVVRRYADAGDQADHTGPEARTVPRGAGLLRNSMAWNGWHAATDSAANPIDDNTTDAAVRWLQARAARGAARGAAPPPPFLLYYGLNLPHEPFTTNATWLARVNASRINQPWAPNSSAALHPFDWHMSVSKGCTEAANTDEAMMLVRRVYLAMCAQADANHGRVLAALDALNLTATTLVVYWSDHGEMAFDARQVLKDSFRDGSARVPLIFAGPGVAANRTVAAHASLLDLWPTLADLAGVRAPLGARGRSLAPAMRAGAPPAVDSNRSVAGEFFAENSDTGSFFLRQGDLKYVAFGHSFPWFTPQAYSAQLFNVSADPNEEVNLAPAMPGVVASMDAALVAALGRSYEDIDAEVMRNDLLIFQEYLTANMTLAQVRKMLVDTYKGFDDDDWARIQLWNSSTPGQWRAQA